MTWTKIINKRGGQKILADHNKNIYLFLVEFLVPFFLFPRNQSYEGTKNKAINIYENFIEWWQKFVKCGKEDITRNVGVSSPCLDISSCVWYLNIIYVLLGCSKFWFNG